MEPTQTPASPDQDIARKVRDEMARQGMSQEVLGSKLSWPQRRVSRRLTGEVAFGVVELGQVAEALGVPVTQFLPASVRAA